jgi:hypothetical protein
MGQFLEPIKVRGDFDLEDLENRCGTIQNMVPCKLIRVTKKTDDSAGKFNAALFEEVEVGSTPPKPAIIKIENPEKIPSIIAEQMAASKKMIFDSTIYVQNVEERVLGFR